MKFGVREICDVVFKAKNNGQLGTMYYTVGQPVLFIDSAKTSTIEGAATTAYATGGRGNSRLISWEGEKTLTFTVEDALLSPIGFALLSGAGLMEASATNKVYVHKTVEAVAGNDGKIDLSDALEGSDQICDTAPIFVMKMDRGSISGIVPGKYKVSTGKKGLEPQAYTALAATSTAWFEGNNPSGAPEAAVTAAALVNQQVFVDFYIEKQAGVTQLVIDAGNFAGYWYVEASTLFRREEDGKDMPAEIVFPNVKIQSNFTFTMASSGDPSTFTFTMDALPGYTHFDKSKRVLCAIQIVDDTSGAAVEGYDSDALVANDSQGYPTTASGSKLTPAE